MKKQTVIFGIGIFLLTLVTAASITFHNEGLVTTYAKGDEVKGWINFSVDNVDFDTPIETNFQGTSITLKELLDLNSLSTLDYDCMPLSCDETYKKGSQITSNYNMQDGDFAGLHFIRSPSSNTLKINFTVVGGAQKSCFNSLKVSLLGEGIYNFTSEAYVDEDCFTKKSGCFEAGRSDYVDATIGSDKYCENITLPPGPAYKLGANLMGTGATTGLKMELMNDAQIILGDCDLVNVDGDGEYTCIVNYNSGIERDYFVCIYGDDTTTGYKIKSEIHESCGMSTGGGQAVDFDVFAKNLKYGPPRIVVNSSNFEEISGGESLTTYAGDYISNNYGTDTCGREDVECIFPFELIGDPQQVSFENVSIKWEDTSGIDVENNKIYELSKEKAKISFEDLVLDLEGAGLIINRADETKLQIYLGTSLKTEVDVTIADSFNFDISPKFAPYNQEVEFKITGKNVTSSSWDFGDGTTQNSQNEKVTHTYSTEGNYTILVTVVDSNGVTATGNFKIIVGDAEEIAGSLIDKYKTRIENLGEDIKNFTSPWMQEKIKESIELNTSNATLTTIEESYLAATNQTDFAAMVTSLMNLGIPISIQRGSSGKLPLEIGASNIDVSYIEDVSSKTASDETELKNAIIGWMGEKYNAEITFEKVISHSDSADEVLLSWFKIDMNRQTSVDEAYLFIDFPVESIEFASNTYGAQSISGATYIPVSLLGRVEFAILSDVNGDELGAYISPSVDKLGNYDSIGDAEKAKGRWKVAIFSVIILIVFGAIGLVIINTWYKKKFGHSLFKRKSELLNITNFIKNARGKGLSDSQIKSKLRAAGWSQSQISAAFKKV